MVERPECLADEIKKGNILDFETANELLLDFLHNVQNKLPSQGQGCAGKSPDDAWNTENPPMKRVTRDALKLFCMRTSPILKIGRNGLTWNGLHYYSDWMIPMKGREAFMKRASDNVKDVWVFAPGTMEWLGNAVARELAHPVAQEPVDTAALKSLIATQNREKKIMKELKIPGTVPSLAERLQDMKAGAALLNPEPVPEPAATVVQVLPNSPIQQAVNKKNRQDRDEQAAAAGITQHAHSSEIRILESQRQRLVDTTVDTYADADIKKENIIQIDKKIETLKKANSQ